MKIYFEFDLTSTPVGDFAKSPHVVNVEHIHNVFTRQNKNTRQVRDLGARERAQELFEELRCLKK